MLTNIARRHFIKQIGIGVTTLSTMPFINLATATANKAKPNVLFIMSDDHTTQAIGAYGSRLAKLNPTPTIDRLAREGMRFDRVFCTNSICTPSRANIMTGQHCQRNGVLDLYSVLPPEKQHLAIEMKKSGYNTAMIGKWHLQQSPIHFDYYCVLPGQGQYHNPIMYTNVGGEPEKVRFDSTHSRVVNVRKFKGHSSDVITDVALDWLKKNNSGDRPFFMMLQYKAPHDLFEHAERYDDYLKDVEIPEPDNLYDQPAEGFGSVATRGENDELIHRVGSSVSKRNTGRNMGRHMRIDRELPDRQYTHEAYQRYLKKYLRCVKGVDDNLKRVFDYLKEQGQLDNTIIIYTGDQGMFLGEHDYIDKRWMYEESMRMPLLVRYPKMIKARSTNGWLINNTDFAPTMLELAGVPAPDYMQGRSFVRALRGESKPTNWRTATYYRYWMHMAHGHSNPGHFGIRTERYKLIFFYGCDFTNVHNGREITRHGGNRFGPSTPVAWELYDLENDPYEMQNVYGDPAYEDITAPLKKQLEQKREQLGETDEKYPHIQAIIDKHWND